MKMKNNTLEKLMMQMFAKEDKQTSLRTGKFGVIYTRVSTLEQATNNGSLEFQAKLNHEFAKRNGIVIRESFGGKFESAKTDGRKEFQRMLTYVRKHKDITYIIISNYDRFSRTGPGAAKISEDLRKEGIIVKSVTQDIDTTTASGRLQENFMHLMNNFDNIAKSERTKLHTKEVMEKGYWPYATPLGYDNLKKKQRACFHEYVITEEGKELKKAFILKAAGKLTNKEIINLLQAKGVRITEKTFSQIISNVFYAGYVTGKLVKGKLIKGHHPPLIDLKTFLKANEVLRQGNNIGVPKVFRHEQVPLKIFVKDEQSGAPFTGYTTKNNWYYKTKSTAVPVNVKAEKLNQQFVKFLEQFEYRSDMKNKLKKLILDTISKKLQVALEDNKSIKKQITEKMGQLEKIEKKYLLDEIDRELYIKHTTKIKSEIAELSQNLGSSEMNSSNLEKAVEKCLSIAQNLSGAWIRAGFENKRRVQSLICPQGVVYNKENEVVRTEKVNSLFALIPYSKRVIEENKKGNLEKDYLNSASVPTKGIEPSHPCEWQILSLLRLPIPPHGLQMVCKYNGIILNCPKFLQGIFFDNNIPLLATILLG